ncbi:MAG TPA: cytochrome P450 [Caldilineaceae bacterium]|nr:cytochrome P450 [Caldilineaceae bacterium]
MTRPFNLFGPAFKANPYPTYAAMREESPFHRRTATDGKTNIWFITRYDDVATLLRDHKRLVKDVVNTLTPEARAARPAPPPLLQLLSNHMLNLDPPDHTRLRALVNKAFTNQVVAQMAERIQRVADDLLDAGHAQGEMDLIEEFAFPLPIIVIAELLGIPPRDRRRFRNWSNAFVTPSANLQRSLKKMKKAGQVMEDFTRYMRRIFDERRQEPRNDLISLLLQAEEDGDTLREEELFSMVILLIVAGHETVVDFLGNGVLALLQNPAQMALLQSDWSHLPAAIEEMARYDGPIERATMRFAAENIPVGDGLTIAQGDAVSLVLAAADRDPAQFPDPELFDIARTPNRHLGFGQGIHYCLGAPLARLEGQIAIRTLLQHYPRLHLAVPVEQLRWRTIPILRGLHHLPVRW